MPITPWLASTFCISVFVLGLAFQIWFWLPMTDPSGCYVSEMLLAMRTSVAFGIREPRVPPSGFI